jgi:hypothetical protein
MRVLNLTEGLRVTEAGIRLSADSDCNEERAAAEAGHRIMRMLAFLFENVLKGRDIPLLVDSFTKSSERHANCLS